MKWVTIADLKSAAVKGLPVRVWSTVPTNKYASVEIISICISPVCKTGTFEPM